jgi:hypothetical protein
MTTRRNGQANPFRLRKQVIIPQVTVGLRDDCRAGLVANQHRNFRVGESALTRLRDEVGAQPVGRDVADFQFLTCFAVLFQRSGGPGRE